MNMSSMSLSVLWEITVSYISSCVINWDFLDLQNYLLNWQTSYLRSVVRFRQEQKISCLFPMTIVNIFSKIRSHEVLQTRAWLRHSIDVPYHFYWTPCSQSELSIHPDLGITLNLSFCVLSHPYIIQTTFIRECSY